MSNIVWFQDCNICNCINGNYSNGSLEYEQQEQQQEQQQESCRLCQALFVDGCGGNQICQFLYNDESRDVVVKRYVDFGQHILEHIDKTNFSLSGYGSAHIYRSFFCFRFVIYILCHYNNDIWKSKNFHETCKKKLLEFKNILQDQHKYILSPKLLNIIEVLINDDQMPTEDDIDDIINIFFSFEIYLTHLNI